MCGAPSKCLQANDNQTQLGKNIQVAAVEVPANGEEPMSSKSIRCQYTVEQNHNPSCNATEGLGKEVHSSAQVHRMAI